MAIILTRQEQLLLNNLQNLSVVDIATIKTLNNSLHITTNSNLLKTIHNLIKKSVFLNIKKGNYYVIKPSSSSDIFHIAQYVSEGYLGLDTALFLYGVKSDYPSAIKIITPKKRSFRKMISGTLFIGIPFGSLCYGGVELNDKIISSKGKTLFDCIYRINLIEDLGSLLRLINILSKTDLKEFIIYSRRLNRISFYEKAGYILETAHAPNWILDEIKKNINNKKVIANLGKYKYGTGRKFINSWNLYDNIDLSRFSVR